MKRIISTLLMAVAVLAAWPGLASAHAALVSSTPADGAQIALTDAPTSVRSPSAKTSRKMSPRSR